jgi:hypothetical protein
MNPIEIGFYIAAIFMAGLLLGTPIAYGWGRTSMANEIYGRRRSSVLRRALRRLDNAVKASKADEWAEVID